MIGETQEEVGATVSCAGASTSDRVAREPPIKLHDAKLPIVTRIEGLDALVIELAAEFEGVPTVRPGNRVFGLPDLVVEARRLFCGSEVRQSGIAKVDGQQPVDARRVTIADAKGIAELSDARSPASTAIQRDMAPTDTRVIEEIAADGSAPIADYVIDRRG